MYSRAIKSLDKNELWYLLALTGSKIQHESSRAEKDLRRLALLCNTLDKNLLQYEEMDPEIEVDETPEQTSPVYWCSERYATGSSRDGSHDSEEYDHLDGSDDSDSNESKGSNDSDSDDSGEWESTEVVDGVLPLADERRSQWLSTYGEDASACTENGGDECDQRVLTLSDFNECHVQGFSCDTSKTLERNLLEVEPRKNE